MGHTGSWSGGASAPFTKAEFLLQRQKENTNWNDSHLKINEYQYFEHASLQLTLLQLTCSSFDYMLILFLDYLIVLWKFQKS